MENPLKANREHHLKVVNMKEHQLLHEFRVLKALVDGRLRAMAERKEGLDNMII